MVTLVARDGGTVTVTLNKPRKKNALGPREWEGQSLHDLPQPTIAKVQGVAAGAGWSLALGCDLVVAAEAITSYVDNRDSTFHGR